MARRPGEWAMQVRMTFLLIPLALAVPEPERVWYTLASALRRRSELSIEDMETGMGNDIVLPQVRFSFAGPLPESRILLVAGGRPPERRWLARAAAGGPLWCVDSGIDACRAGGVLPERIIGDGDSASSAGWNWGMSLGVPVEVHNPDKDLTDLQLALKRAGSIYGQATVILTGVWGGRFDHAFSNIFSLLGSEVSGGGRCCAADETEVMLILKGTDAVAVRPAEPPAVISLLPLSAECTGVAIEGVRWPLRETKLKQGWPYAVSNRPVPAETVHIAVSGGWLGVYLCWDEGGTDKPAARA